MNTIDFANQYIQFNKTSLITGAFNIDLYPFLELPMSINDDIDVKTFLVYKGAGCMGTVFLEIIMAKHVRCDVGDAYFVAQTDDDAKTWGVARGKEFILGIEDVKRLSDMSVNERSRFTQEMWMFRDKKFYISGPGKTSRQSKQVRKVYTDESHLEANFEHGALKEFEDRKSSAGWMGKATHATTAANQGQECDEIFHKGSQFENHWQCPSCQGLIWPLWRPVSPAYMDSKTYYGKEVFHWNENGTVEEKLNSIHAICPHCGSRFEDTPKDRFALMSKHYVAMNPNPEPGIESVRWNIFSTFTIPWRQTLQKYIEAIEAAKLGNLAFLENFCKKQLCGSWVPTLPDFGEGGGSGDYRVGDEWGVEDSVKIMGIDFQAGKADEGEHLWVLVDQWDSFGNSRRLFFGKVSTFSQAEEIQKQFGVESKNVYVDSGHDNRRVFRECGMRKWYATRGSDAVEINHRIRKGDEWIIVPMPYSQTAPQSGIVGQKQPKKLRAKKGSLPDGWAYQITMANPTLYSYLHALQTGMAKRYFGVASDFPDDYTKNMPAFIPVIEKDKRGIEKVIWKKVRVDHPHDCQIQSLLGAIRAGYYPLANNEKETE